MGDWACPLGSRPRACPVSKSPERHTLGQRAKSQRHHTSEGTEDLERVAQGQAWSL